MFDPKLFRLGIQVLVFNVLSSSRIVKRFQGCFIQGRWCKEIYHSQEPEAICSNSLSAQNLPPLQPPAPAPPQIGRLGVHRCRFAAQGCLQQPAVRGCCADAAAGPGGRGDCREARLVASGRGGGQRRRAAAWTGYGTDILPVARHRGGSTVLL